MSYKRNTQFYKKAIKEYGISAQGVHWNSKYTQYKRFEILTQYIKKDISNSTIVDIGCGFGEYYKYLKNNHKLPQQYIGIDCESFMIDIAKKRFPQIEFIVANALTDQLIKSDYYICSGALNILGFKDIKIFIQNCFNYSTKGFIFNILKSDSFIDIDISELLIFCRTFTQNIYTKDNYLDNDLTIFLKK